MAKNWKEKYRGKTGSMVIDPFFSGDYLKEYSLDIGGKILPSYVNEYVRFCSFLLDPNSPYVVIENNVLKRRELLVEELGYYGDFDYNFEVRLLLEVYRNNEWTLYCAEQTVFSEFIERVNSPIGKRSEDSKMDEKKEMEAVMLKDKYLESLDKILERNNKRFKSIFENDKDLIDAANKVVASVETLAKVTQSKGRIN